MHAAQPDWAITDADLDALRDICRCGTYQRIRTAIRKGHSTWTRH